MKDPAFLLYSKDFYEGTRLMLPEERACYMDLLIYQHQHGFIPDNPKRMMLYCSGIDEATLQATLEAKFERCEQGWYNKKLKQVIESRQEFSNKQSDNGVVGQFLKKAKAKLNADTYLKLREFVYDKENKQFLLESLKNSNFNYEATLEAMLQALLKHLAIVNAIENENEIQNVDKVPNFIFEIKDKLDPDLYNYCRFIHTAKIPFVLKPEHAKKANGLFTLVQHIPLFQQKIEYLPNKSQQAIVSGIKEWLKFNTISKAEMQWGTWAEMAQHCINSINLQQTKKQ